jgi:hypothetical protein
MSVELSKCLSCGKTENQFPLVQLRFKGITQWICPQCLPALIHKPGAIAAKLPGAEIPITDPHHH